jgi:cytochrome b561
MQVIQKYARATQMRNQESGDTFPTTNGTSLVSVSINEIVRRRSSFDRVIIALHWATVLILVALFATIWFRSQAHHSAAGQLLLQVHRSLGVSLWFITCVRLLWRLGYADLPPFPSNMGPLHRKMVQATECSLYALLIVQPATGLGASLFSGRGFALLGFQVPALLHADHAVRNSLQWLHDVGAWALAILVGSHAAAALFHHLVLRDDVLARMAPFIARKRQ